MHYRDINKAVNRYIFGILICLYFIPNVIFSKAKVSSNVELISSAVQEMAYEVIDTLKIQQGTHVSIHVYEEVNPRAQFVFNHFCVPFKCRSIELYVSPDSMDDGIELKILQNTITVHYGMIFRKKFLGKKWISRHIQTNLTILAVQKQSQKVLYLNEKKKENRDEFLHQFLESVQYPRDIFDEFYPISKSGIWKYLEPVFVIGLVIGIGYLFYSIRS